MPTISGAIAKAEAFQATGGPSTFQAVTATTATIGSPTGSNSFTVQAADGNLNMRWANAAGSIKWSTYLGVGTEWKLYNNALALDAITVATATSAVTFAAGITATTLTTADPTGGAGVWKLGIANAVSPTAPNRTITVDIGGTLYYLHAKTTNN